MMSDLQSGRSDATRHLLRLLVQREGDDRGWPPAAAVDWRTFRGICENHQLVPLVYCRLRQLTASAVPSELLEYLRVRFQESCAYSYRLASRLVSLTSMLEREGVSVLAFKGPSLAMTLYGGLSLRQCLDLDLMIRAEQVVKAAQLMKSCGYEPTPTPARPQLSPYLCRPENSRHLERGKEIQYLSPDGAFYVDLHWQFADRFWRPFTPDVAKLWERAVRQDLPQGSVHTLGREDLFLALCAHGTRHRWWCLKWLVDVAEILRRADALDWSRVEEMTRISPGNGAAASVAVSLAHDLLEVPVPAEAARILPATDRTRALASAIREELLSRGFSSGDEHTTLLALEGRSVTRIKYRATRIFRYPESLFRQIIAEIGPKDRGLIRLPRKLEFLYHFMRPVRLLLTHSVRVARTFWRTAG
jgi:putative nucleotidyltransferase-like protein